MGSKDRFLLPLFDRLAAAGKQEVPGWLRTVDFEDFKESIARHVEQLLNTRLLSTDQLDGYPLLKRSILEYGVIDFHSTSLDPDRAVREYAAIIEQALAAFEPRLFDAKVKGSVKNGVPHFQVRANLSVEPVREGAGVSFYAVLGDDRSGDRAGARHNNYVTIRPMTGDA